MIEGDIESGQNVVVVEDLVSTGSSSIKAVDALRERGCVVKGMVAIFTYGFDEATANFKKAKCRLETLTNYNSLINAAVKKEYIVESDLKSLKEWRANPSNWGESVSKS